jgi:hypothetical protein
MMSPVAPVFLILLGVIAVAGITAGIVLAVSGYSSAGPFSIASACVGVLGTLAAEGRTGLELPPDEPTAE